MSPFAKNPLPGLPQVLYYEPRRRFLGSVRGFAAVHDALEPVAVDGKRSTINPSTINRFMGSGHGLFAVHIPHEPRRVCSWCWLWPVGGAWDGGEAGRS
jgi:hypothetical protein